MIKQGFIAAAFVKELEVITPFGKQDISMSQVYPGKSFVGFLPVFESEESAIEHGGIVCALNIDKKEAE